jgi:hypothetical protein
MAPAHTPNHHTVGRTESGPPPEGPIRCRALALSRELDTPVRDSRQLLLGTTGELLNRY